MARDIITIVSYACYTVTFSIGGLIVAWVVLPPIAAAVISLLAFVFWPFWLSATLLSSRRPHSFSGQIDHPGGGVGVVIAMSVSLIILLNGNYDIAILSFLLGIPALGVSFSLVSEWLECRITELRFKRSERRNPPNLVEK